MKYHAGGYKIETAKQRKERLDKTKREAEQQARQNGEFAKRFTENVRDDGKDHTPPYTYRGQTHAQPKHPQH